MSELVLTKGQTEARTMVASMLADEANPFGVLTGYAGTGKTTMLRVLADDHGDPFVLTPTGKAALRVHEATGLEASTIHRWLYRPSENPQNGEVRWQKRSFDDIQIPTNRVIIIDEASMVSEETWADIWGVCSSIGIRVLLVGDRFQLPPVSRKDTRPFSALADLRTSYRADLNEVVRQALDSPIIRASMMVRQGETQAMDAVMDVLEAVPRQQLVERFLKMSTSRALIAHRNATRQALNLEVRKSLGYDDRALKIGEPLLVLYNNYAIDRMNGEVVVFNRWAQSPDDAIAVRDRWKNLSTMMSFGLADIEGQPAILSQEEVFAQTDGMPETTVKRAAIDHAVYEWGYPRKLAPSHLNANLGYCLTFHKSQGSEWDDVIVLIEGSIAQGKPFSHEGRRFLYTGLTRAKKNVVICYE